jgi:uncharacterized protein YegL
MTKPNATLINIILDRSGSMKSIASDTIGGFNQFIEDQKKVTSDETLVSLYQFDNEYTPVFENRPLAAIEALTAATFVPRGNTALLDAIGKTIVSTGEFLAKMPEDQRPSLVIMVIITDGQENCSTEYTRAQIFEMTQHQTEVYKWQFVFLGANQNAIAEGQKIGMRAVNSMSYAANSVGIGATYGAVSSNLAKSRRSRDIADIAFTTDQRTEAAAGDSKIINSNVTPNSGNNTP